ncbi:putative quinol monooxygenase [Sulfurimonas sp. HSL3-7]|uniref:putative quinol monooxygenase n=1 Tax=Sulfonitrofixus jiaomeiensis TaxID=3131938 RepID=UPI0031F958FE
MVIANQIIIEAVEGKSEVLKPLLNVLVEATLMEKGCQKYELYQLDEDKDVFFIIEIWKNKKRYKAHLDNEHFQKLCSRMQELIEIQVSNALNLTN